MATLSQSFQSLIMEQSLHTQIATRVEEFFTQEKETTGNSIELISPSYLSPEKILQACIDKYFNVMKDNFDQYRVGPVFVRRYLVLAHDDACMLALQLCDNLVKMSKCMTNIGEMIACVKAAIEILYTNFQPQNEIQQKEYINAYKKRILVDGFEQSVKTRYSLLFPKLRGGKSVYNQSISNKTRASSKFIKSSKFSQRYDSPLPFYTGGEIGDFVTASEKTWIAKCDARLKLLCPPYTGNENDRVDIDTVQSFEILKASITASARDVLTENQKNREFTVNLTDKMIAEKFNFSRDAIEKEIMRNPIDLENDYIENTIRECKQRCMNLISTWCTNIGLNSPTAAEYKAEFESKLKDMEKNVFQCCEELLKTSKGKAIDVFNAEANNRLNAFQLWLDKSGNDKLARIWNRNVKEAVNKSTLECNGFKEQSTNNNEILDVDTANLIVPHQSLPIHGSQSAVSISSKSSVRSFDGPFPSTSTESVPARASGSQVKKSILKQASDRENSGNKREHKGDENRGSYKKPKILAIH